MGPQSSDKVVLHWVLAPISRTVFKSMLLFSDFRQCFKAYLGSYRELCMEVSVICTVLLGWRTLMTLPETAKSKWGPWRRDRWVMLPLLTSQPLLQSSTWISKLYLIMFEVFRDRLKAKECLVSQMQLPSTTDEEPQDCMNWCLRTKYWCCWI